MKTVWHWRHSLGSLLVAALGLFCVLGSASATDFTQRSVSKSGQFIVYSSDVRLRLAVSDYVETAKQDVLEALGLGDHWKFPIVVNLRRPASTDTGQALRQVRLIQTESSWRVEIEILLREGELKQVRFPQLVTRALLLELAYRDHPPAVGTPCIDPPSWLVEGLAENMQVRATGSKPNAALFRQLIETGRIPKIQDFLANNIEVMDATSLAVHDSCASSLVDMLAGTPEGKPAFARMIKGLWDSNGDPVALLLKYFPALGGSATSLEKWWTLGLARYSTLDNTASLTVAETDTRLTALLTLSVVTDEKSKTKKAFELADYKNFLKFPSAKPALLAQSAALGELMRQTHPLMRPVIQEYIRISNNLATGKKRGMEEALRAIVNYRELIVTRMDNIDDYLNWYEATQMPEQSGAFDDFLRGAKAMENWTPPKRNDAISKYIDQLQREFQ